MKYEIIRNDITNMDVDAIVLPSNSKLKEGSGTSNAIFEKAGRKELVKELKQFGTVEVGASVPTLGYELDATFILHTVVPKWKDGKHQEYDLLSSAYLSTLILADNMSCESLAFPLLAAGNNGFDLKVALEVAKQSIESYTPTNKLSTVYLVVYDREVMALLRASGEMVSEEINESYVLKRNLELKLPIEKVKEEGEEVMQKFLADGIQMVRGFFDNPENRKKLIEEGAKIAVKAAVEVAKQAK